MITVELEQQASTFRRYMFGLPHEIDFGYVDGVRTVVLHNAEETRRAILNPLFDIASEVKIIGQGWNGDFSRSLYPAVAQELDRHLVARRREHFLDKDVSIDVVHPLFLGCLRPLNTWVPLMLFDVELEGRVFDVLTHARPLGFPALHKDPAYARAERVARKAATNGKLGLIFDSQNVVLYFPASTVLRLISLITSFHEAK